MNILINKNNIIYLIEIWKNIDCIGFWATYNFLRKSKIFL